MGRMSLVIADNDAEYLAGFEKFLIVNYPQRFDIVSFTSGSKLSGYLDSKPGTDILLIGPQLFKKELMLNSASLVLLLNGDAAGNLPEGLNVVMKYQNMDRLVSEMLRLYSESFGKSCPSAVHGAARIVSVYSPCGGSGKTCIAAGLSILCAGRGEKSFYLNLEDIPTTGMFFQGDTDQSFSNVIYHLKGNSGNLQLKLEGAKCIDKKYGVHYFKPPENIQEMCELTKTEVSRLVGEFKKSVVYDIVLIDLSNGFNSINTTVLVESDIILLALLPDLRSSAKYAGFMEGLALIEKKLGVDLAGRVIPIINRSSGKPSRAQGLVSVNEYGRCAELVDCTGNPVENAAFLSCLNRVLEYALPHPAASIKAGLGGEFIA